MSTNIDAGDRTVWATAIATELSPPEALLEFFFANQGDRDLCIDIFERVAARTDIRNYWVYRFTAQLYAATGNQPTAGFFESLARHMGQTDDRWNARINSQPDGTFQLTAKAIMVDAAYEVKRILTASQGNAALFEFVLRTHQTNPAFCVEVFERVAPSLPITHYWTFYNMALAYRAIGDARASFLMAAFGEKIEPQSPSWHLYQIMYHYHLSKNQNEEADIIALRQFDRAPDNPIVEGSKILDLLKKESLDVNSDGDCRCSLSFHTKLVVEASVLEVPEPKILGPLPLALLGLQNLEDRFAIHVSEIKDATVIIQNNSVLVCDSYGNLIPKFCIAISPQALHERHIQLNFENKLIEPLNIECAIILKDKFSSKNLCHFLLDYMTRLDLYRDAGVDVAAASVITESFSEPFMRTIAQAFGAGPVISTSQSLSLSVRNLYISDNCTTTFQHPGHLASPWMVDVIRNRFRDITDHVSRKDVRIYISRGDASIRRVVNEAEVEFELRARGFISIQASRMEFYEQVSLFGGATHVVSAHGAGLTNIVFCPEGCEILEIFHPIANNPTYAVLAAGCGLSYTALTGIDGDSSDPIYNDPLLPEQERLHVGGRGEMNGRNIKVPIDRLVSWLSPIV